MKVQQKLRFFALTLAAVALSSACATHWHADTNMSEAAPRLPARSDPISCRTLCGSATPHFDTSTGECRCDFPTQQTPYRGGPAHPRDYTDP